MMVANKNAKGDGAVYQRNPPTGPWCATIELPPGPNGQRRRKTVTVTSAGKTEKQAIAELELKRKNMKRRLLKDGDIITAGTTVAQWMNIWYRDIASVNVRPKTAAVYRTMVTQYIIPSIGKVQLERLSSDHVRQVAKFIESKKLSSTTAAQAHRVLSVAMKYAAREGRMLKNVVADTDAPRKAANTLNVLTPEDAVKALVYARGDRSDREPDRLWSRWAAALFLGPRQGELLGLEIDRVTDVLDLSWQLQRISWEHGCRTNCGKKRGTDCPDRKITKPPDWEHRYLTGGLWLSRPKSDAGTRIVPLPEILREPFAARIEAASKEPNPFGLMWTAAPKIRSGMVLPLTGLPIDPSDDNAAWHKFLTDAGVNRVRLHDARHTTASLLLAAGVSDPIIIKILGHSSYVQSHKYMTVDRAQLDDAMKRVSNLLPLEN